MKQIFLLLISILLLISSVNASIENLGIYKQNECITLKQVCGNCTYVNITTVSNPNSTIMLRNVNMTKSLTSYTYNFCNTSYTGNYIVDGFGDSNGVSTVWAYIFTITKSGLATSSDFFTVLIYLLFIITMLGLGYSILITFIRITKLDETILDVLVSAGAYLLLILTTYLSNTYLNDSFIDGITNKMVIFAVWTNLWIPIALFVVAVTIRALDDKRYNAMGRIK